MTSVIGKPLFNVNRFWEKPPLAEARQLMKTGGLWNTFVTIGHRSAFLKLLTDTVLSAVSEISNALTQGDPRMRDVPRLLEEVTGVRPSAPAA